MKISTFYLTDISEYDNFTTKLSNDINENFFNTGFSSLNISRFINFFRSEVSKYIRLKYNKKYRLVVLLPRNNKELIEKIVENKIETIEIYLKYEIVKEILEGLNSDYIDYLNSIIEQVESYLTTDMTHNFSEYLVIQMPNLSKLCANELKIIYSQDFLKNNLKEPKSWKNIARQSTIFNDYYNFLKEDVNMNKSYFIQFIKLLYSQL